MWSEITSFKYLLKFYNLNNCTQQIVKFKNNIMYFASSQFWYYKCDIVTDTLWYLKFCFIEITCFFFYYSTCESNTNILCQVGSCESMYTFLQSVLSDSKILQFNYVFQCMWKASCISLHNGLPWLKTFTELFIDLII